MTDHEHIYPEDFTPAPPPEVWATFPGRYDEEALGEISGPDIAGRYLMAVEIHYRPDEDKSRVGFAYVPAAVEEAGG